MQPLRMSDSAREVPGSRCLQDDITPVDLQTPKIVTLHKSESDSTQRHIISNQHQLTHSTTPQQPHPESGRNHSYSNVDSMQGNTPGEEGNAEALSGRIRTSESLEKQPSADSLGGSPLKPRSKGPSHFSLHLGVGEEPDLQLLQVPSQPPMSVCY
jgi:hypothetical protein